MNPLPRLPKVIHRYVQRRQFNRHNPIDTRSPDFNFRSKILRTKYNRHNPLVRPRDALLYGIRRLRLPKVGLLKKARKKNSCSLSKSAVRHNAFKAMHKGSIVRKQPRRINKSCR